MALAGLGLCCLVVVIYKLTRGGWIEGLLAGITLAMAILPEEIPVVLTVFLALGAWRISQKGVLTRRIPAVEALGSATTLCVDKTGTLTLNRMRIVSMWANGRVFAVPDEEPTGTSPPGLDSAEYEPFHQLVEYGILAGEVDPFDPMERAFADLGERYFQGSEHLHADWELVHEYSLSPDLLAMSHVWRSPQRDAFVIAAKGAPEAIADLCHLDQGGTQRLSAATDAMAESGFRVLGVARAIFHGDQWPGAQHDFDFELVGLVGLADPPRPSVPQALAECRQAGLRVVMITGDYPSTAQAIARRIGLQPDHEVITGPQLDEMLDEQLGSRIATCSIFARMVPEQKLRLIKALKTRGEIVAMTGDGVNDAPALRAADIGAAMGQRGGRRSTRGRLRLWSSTTTSSIVAAVRTGRRIYDNPQEGSGVHICRPHPIIAGR